MNEEEIKERLNEFSTYEEITAVTLIRMIYALNNDDYNNISDKNLWDCAVSNGLIYDV